MGTSVEQVDLFAALFKGRDDVFAKRWERADKNGYSPAYEIDNTDFERHKTLGGTFKDYDRKRYSALNDEAYKAHLEGRQTIGIYPLLQDNTSWFVAVDFDEHGWMSDITAFYNQCTTQHIPAYIERSRSGNGGHCWIFFSSPYPAAKSRAIIRWLLNTAGLLHKTADRSFDRIFPNQDFLSGRGLGNLIALPLQGKSVLDGNTCFLDGSSLEVIEDQWHFLGNIQRVDISGLDELWNLTGNGLSNHQSKISSNTYTNQGLTITLTNKVEIQRDGLSSETVLFLRDKLKVANPTYFIRKASGKSTHGINSSISTLSEEQSSVSFPRGFIGPFLRYCRQQKLNYHFDDRRQKLPETSFSLIGTLRDYQQPAVDTVAKKDFGVIVLPPGSGKTIIGLNIIADKKLPALIIVHRRQLFDQWIERIQSFLGIPRHKIGRIKGRQIDIGEQITVAMIQTLNVPENRSKVEKVFGLILVDECHHVPAAIYRETLNQFHTWYLYGLTATPIRKNRDQQLIYDQLGELLYEMPVNDHSYKNSEVIINVKDTDFQFPFNEATDEVETLLQVLIHDSERNSLIVDDVKSEIGRSRTVLILTERKAHLDILNQYLKQDFETIVLSGDDTDASRKSKMLMIDEGRFQALLQLASLSAKALTVWIVWCLPIRVLSKGS